MTDHLFNAVLTQVDGDYSDSRSQFLRDRKAALLTLDRPQELNQSDNTKVLIEVLRSRLENEQEFFRLEHEFQEKVFRLCWLWPKASHAPRDHIDTLDGLLIPGEQAPP